jgi:hypothetical protein
MFLRAYYDKLTGNGLKWYALTGGVYRIPTFEEDYATFIELFERNADTIGWIDFESGEYFQDFAQCNGYRVNPQTLELEFSYPDPNATEPQEPVYQKPLTEQVKELEQQNAELLLDLVMKDGRITEVEQTQADLILDLTMKGVI